MSPETRTRLANGLLVAAVPTLAFSQIAFYSWAGERLINLQDWRWWTTGVAAFVALVLAAGLLTSGGEKSRSQPPERAKGAHQRGISDDARIRLAWTLMVAAFLAYLFYSAAFASWWFSLPFLIRFHFLSFQDWRWWTGAFIALFGLLIAAGVVMSRMSKSRTLPLTPIDDPSHEIRLDERGDEIEPDPAASRRDARSSVPRPDDAESSAADFSKTGKYVPQMVVPWGRFALVALLMLLSVHYWLVREISGEYVVVIALVLVARGFSLWFKRIR